MRIQFATRTGFLLCLLTCTGLITACGPTPSATSTPTVVPRQIDVAPLAQLGQGIATDIAWSHDGTRLAVASSLGIYVYDGRILELLYYMKTEGWEQALSFSPDNRFLLSLSEKGIRLWDVETGDIIRVLEGQGTQTTAIAASPVVDQDDFFLAAGAEGLVRLWKAKSGLLVHTLRGPESNVTDIAFSPDGTLIAAGFETGDIYLWDVQDETRLADIGHPGIAGLVFSPDGTRLVWVASDGRIYALSIERDRNGDLNMPPVPSVSLLTMTSTQPGGDFFAIGIAKGTAASPDRQILASLSQDGAIQLWRVEGCLETECTIQSMETLSGFTPAVNSVSALPDGQVLAIGYVNGRLDLWQKADVPDGWVPVRAIEAHAGAVLKTTVSPDGQVIVSAGDDNVVRVWRLDNDDPLYALRGHAWLITDIGLSPNGSVIASASCDKTVKLWRSEDGEPAGMLSHPACVREIAFSADGQWLLTGADDGLVRVWDWSNGTVVQTLEGHESAVWQVAWSPDDTLIASGDDDGLVRVWSRVDGKMMIELKGCRTRVTGLTFDAEGELVMAGSLDHTVRLWQIGGGVLLHTLNQGGAVNDLTLLPDERVLITGLDNGTVRLWQIQDK